MKISRIAAATAVALISVAGIATPALAAEPTDTLTTHSASGTADGGITAQGPLEDAIYSPTGQDERDPSLERLWKLAETQSEAEVQALYDSGVPAEFLVDTLEGEWKLLAGYAKDEAADTLALQPVGPGCSGTSMCLRNTNPYGYTGTGTLNGSWTNVSYIAAGDRKGRFQASGGSGTTLNPGVAFTLSLKVHFTQIQRY